MLRNEFAVFRTLVQNDLAYRIEEGDIAAGRKRNVNSGSLRCMAKARIEDDHYIIGVRAAVGLHALKEHRMCVGHVATSDHIAITFVQIIVGGRRAIAPKHASISSGGAGHAQKAVAIDMVLANTKHPTVEREGLAILE